MRPQSSAANYESKASHEQEAGSRLRRTGLVADDHDSVEVHILISDRQTNGDDGFAWEARGGLRGIAIIMIGGEESLLEEEGSVVDTAEVEHELSSEHLGVPSSHEDHRIVPTQRTHEIKGGWADVEQQIPIDEVGGAQGARRPVGLDETSDATCSDGTVNVVNNTSSADECR